MSNSAKKAVRAFVDHLELNTRKREVELVDRFLYDSREMIESDEWGVALENLLENLNEINYRLDEKEISLVHNSLAAMGIDPKDWNILEGLT